MVRREFRTSSVSIVELGLNIKMSSTSFAWFGLYGKCVGKVGPIT